MTKILHTLKGSAIQRFKKFAVGKYMHPFLYFHCQYASIVPSAIFKDALDALQFKFPSFRFNLLRWNVTTNDLTFINCTEFDSEPTPTVGDFVTVYHDGKTSTKITHSNLLYHHKWLWVKDEYAGFDVEASFAYSRSWLSNPKIDSKKIGHKSYWSQFFQVS